MARIRKKIGSDAVIYGQTQSKGNLESDSGLIIKEGENNPPILDTTGNAIEVRKGVNVDEAVTVDSLTIDNIGMYEQIVVTNNNGTLTASTISLDELESLENINGNVQEQLDHEAGERAEADRVLTEGLASESSDRADADNTLTQAIESEADTRRDADDSLSSRINAEVNTRTTEVASLTEAIQTEADARLQEDTVLNNKIDTEISDREEDVSDLNNAISGLTTQLNEEATARANKDSELQTAIETEASTRASDVSGLRSDLTDETSERIQADSGLTESLNSEIANRQSADALLQTAIENEARDRNNGDSSLNQRLIAIEERIVLPWEGHDTLAKESDLNTAIGQITTDLGKKVDKITATHSDTVAYVQTSGGDENFVPISDTDTPNAIALRNVNGTIEVPMPNADNEATNKSYVDSEIYTTREVLNEHIQDWNNPHSVTKEQVGLQYVENYPIDEHPQPDSPNYVSSGGVYTDIETVQGTIYAHTMDENNPHNVTKEQLQLEHVVNRTMDSEPESGSMNYVESGGVYNAIQNVISSLQVHEDDHYNPHQVTKEQVGLDQVDNTSDADKPISSAQRDEFNAIQGILDEHINNTSNPHQVTKAQVGLGYVENYPMDSTPSPSSSNYVSSGGVYTEIDRVEGLINGHVYDSSNPHNVTKEQVGLGSVDNTSDIDKPVSSAQQTAIDGVQSNLDDHEMDTNNPHNVTKEQLGLGNVDNTSDMDKPVSSLQSVAIGNVQSELDTHEQTYADSTTYGHIKFDTNIGNGNRTDVAISEAGIKDYVNSSIGTATSNFLGTYNAVTDLGISQSTVDAWTDPPSSSVETTVGNAITTAVSVTPTNNDYVFVSVNKSATVGIDWFWRFKYDGSAWLYEYTLNNSSFTQAQWDAINSGITTTKVGNYDTHVASRSNPHNVTKAQVGLGNADNTSDLNKPISTATQTALDNKVGTVNQTGSGYVSAVAIDTTDKTKLNVTRTAIPNVAVTGGTAESNKYVSAIATNGHGISVTKATLPSLTKGTDSGSGNVVSDISVSGHQITLTKITAITDVSGKANRNLDNISGLDTANEGKAILVSSTGGIEFGEAGKVDDVQLNGTSVVSNKIANLPAYPTVNNGTFNIQGSGTTASSFGANQSGTTTLNIKGSGGTTVTKSANNEITISTGTIPTVNNGTLNLKGAGTTVTSFTANQSATSNLDIVGDGSTTVTPDATNKKITISTPVLSTVATSGSYNDLSNKPTIPTVNNGTLTIKGESTTATTFTANSSTSPTLVIKGSGGTTVTGATSTITISTPALSTVATSGSYNDLTNKPTIPTVNNKKIDFKVGDTVAQTFTANQSTDVALSFAGSGGTSVSADDTNKKITITSPSVGDGTLTVTQNGTSKGTFKANASSGTTIALTDTWTPMTGATSSANGTVGYVNAVPPKDGYNTKYLRADGTWTVPPDHTYTVNNGTLTIKGENTTATTFTANSSTSPTLAIKGSGATTVTGASGTITVSSTDQSVTAVGNHYVPSGGTTTSASGGADTNITNLASGSGVNVVTGVTIDGAGHVTGVTSKALRSVNNTYTVNNGKLSLQGNGTEVASFTANQSSGSTFNLANGTGISLTNDTTNKKITVNGVAVSKTTAGLCPQLPNETTTTKYLRQDGTWQVPPDHTYTVNNGTLSIQGNGTTASTFTANQSGNTTLNIKGSGGTSVTKSADNEITVSSTAVGNGTLTITQGGATKGTFTANATGDTTIALTDNNTTYSAGPGLTLDSTTFSETFPIYYARPNETTATATLTATIGNFPSAYKDGIMIALRMPFKNVASTTLNVNGLGAKNVYYANNTTTATTWGQIGCVALLVYETTTVSTGCWKAVYSYDSNTTYSVPKNATASAVTPSNANTNGFWYCRSITNSLSGADANPFLQYHTSNNDFRILTTAYSTSWVQQIATDLRTNYLYYRRKENGTWKDWVLLNPTLATVATSGSYNDLSDKPSIPTVNNATLTIQKNGTNVQTFTANQSTNATANITVPTKLSDLTNDVVKDGSLILYGNDGSETEVMTANQSDDTYIGILGKNGITTDGSSVDGEIYIGHTNNVTAGTIGSAGATSGSSVIIPYAKYDANGHITSKGNRTHTVTGFLASGTTFATINNTSVKSNTPFSLTNVGNVPRGLFTHQDQVNIITTTTVPSAITQMSTDVNCVPSYDAMKGYADNVLERAYPVGSIYMNASSNTNPATLLGFGTWTQLAPGRVLMGAGDSSYPAGSEGGEATHTLTTDEMPSHGHSVSVNDASIRASVNIRGGYFKEYDGSRFSSNGSRSCQDNTGNGNWGEGLYLNADHGHSVNQSNAGGGQAHNNLQPYLVVYMWQRTE